MRSKPRTFICLLATVFLLTACSGIKERETNRLLVLHKRYSGSVIRIAMETENGWLMGGTAFYTGQETGFITARHCLMYSDSQGEEHQFDSLMLHIPSCESGYKANMGEAVNEVNNYAEYIENDWANFVPDEDKLARRPLRYDPNYPLYNGMQMFIAGYPGLNREYNHSGVVPIELLATISFFADTTKHHFATTMQTGNKKYNAVKTVEGLSRNQGGVGISGGPVMIWDNETEDFVAIGILTRLGQSLDTKKQILFFIRPQIPPLPNDSATNKQ